jgi:hypothetical protein
MMAVEDIVLTKENLHSTDIELPYGESHAVYGPHFAGRLARSKVKYLAPWKADSISYFIQSKSIDLCFNSLLTLQ